MLCWDCCCRGLRCAFNFCRYIRFIILRFTFHLWARAKRTRPREAQKGRSVVCCCCCCCCLVYWLLIVVGGLLHIVVVVVAVAVSYCYRTACCNTALRPCCYKTYYLVRVLLMLLSRIDWLNRIMYGNTIINTTIRCYVPGILWFQSGAYWYYAYNYKYVV